MKNIVLAIPVKNCAKYLPWLGRQILNFDYPRENISVAFLENDSDDNSWEVVQKVAADLSALEYRRVDADQIHTGFKLAHESRHVESVQIQRLKSLYVIRQKMIDDYLRDNDYLWYIDADCIYVPEHSIKEMLRAKADIVVPILYLPNGFLYDCTTCKFMNGQALKVNELAQVFPGETFIEVDLANAPFMASREVLQKVRYEGCADGDQEGPCFSRNAAKLGIKPVAALGVKILHAAVTGSKIL